MGKYLGVDWASKGWFAVMLRDEGEDSTDLFPSIWTLWQAHNDADRICIDIPIGLPSDGKRACDRDAKDCLQAVNRRVFYTPTRQAIQERNLEDAKAVNEEAGYSIENQAWSIVPRIREVDSFLQATPAAQEVIVETHPEVCFYGLNGREPIREPKDTADGIDARMAVLAEEPFDARGVRRDGVETFLQPDYAPHVSGEDDIVDALAAAVTAKRGPGRWATLPAGEAVFDAEGLPMRIVYPDEARQTTLSAVVPDTNGN